MHPFLGKLIVNFVLLLICFIAYSSQIFVIWPWYGSVLSVDLITLLGPFNAFVLMLLWNYFLCVYTDPGRVPESYRPDTHEDGYEVKKLTGQPRFCRMCQKYKPPRAHHCRQCDRCVLRMDHHCPWINNCVGHANHGHFIRFLCFVDISCAYHLVMVSKRVMAAFDGNYQDQPTTTELIMIIMNYVCCIPVLLAVGGFSLYHLYALINNTTTIEGWEKDKVAVMVRKGKLQEVKYPYDIGMRKNLESVLGPNPLVWWWPRPTPGNGLRFEVSTKDGIPWPPKESDLVPSKSPANMGDGSPWTYSHESLNPDLMPTNTNTLQSQQQARRRRRQGNHDSMPGTSSLPPYHVDYGKDEVELQQAVQDGYLDDDEISSDDEPPSMFPQDGLGHIRRGSEGYEIQNLSRDEMLRRYLESIGEQPDRYLRYIPQPESESEEEEDDDDDNIPLIQRQQLIAQTSS